MWNNLSISDGEIALVAFLPEGKANDSNGGIVNV